MNWILLAISVIFGTSKNVFSKLCPKGCVNGYNAVVFVVAFAGLLILSKSAALCMSFYVLIMAMLYAICTVAGQVSYIKAVEKGDFSICSLLYSTGFVIPAICGAIIYDEKITAFQIIGLLILIASFVVSRKIEGNAGSGKKWILFAIMAMGFSGLVGIIQKVFRMSDYGTQINSLLVIAFLIMSILSIILSVPEVKELRKCNAKTWIFAAAMGICVMGANKINLYLSGELSSMIFFPLVNGGAVIMSVFSDTFIFKQPIDKRKCLAVVLGILAIVVISVK